MNKFSAGKASILALTAVFAVSAFLLGKAFTTVFAASTQGKIEICHAKPADTAKNGWVSINVSQKAIVTGTSKHATEHDADIIPSFTFDYGTGPIFYAGKNWDAAGQAVWNNGCKAVSTPTPTPSGTPTPTCDPAVDEECQTPVPTPTPTPFDACPNLDGVQPTVPDGYDVDANDNCVPATPDDVCANIDGIQTSVPDGLHLDAAGLNCVSFSNANPPENNSTPQGQVLGASTMAKTGSFAENVYLAIMLVGGTLSAFGIKKLAKASR